MKLIQEVFDVLVIGGGAAGMMAASQAAKKGKKVLILEKNRSLGVKLKISGGGRCNITNNEQDTRAFLQNYGQASDFLFSAFSKFGVLDTFSFFESLGLPLVVQARNRVFPHTQKAFDVFSALLQNLQKYKVVVQTNCLVKKFNSHNGHIESVNTNHGTIHAKSFILATGGVSHPQTGSTGDGFLWLSALGHSVKKPTPTIVPLAAEEQWVKSLAGVSLSFMKITFFLDGKKQFFKTGKVLFTHFGLSGPLILNIASDVSELLKEGIVTAQIDAYPDTDLGALDERIVKVFDKFKNNELKTAFKEIVPRGTNKALQTLFPQIDFSKKVHSVTSLQRKKIVNILKTLPVTILGLMGNDRAVSADGGVSLTEIDMRTMRSNLIKNLYVVGDLLNINRPSGGYSLQLCWTTGYVAGNSA